MNVSSSLVKCIITGPKCTEFFLFLLLRNCLQELEVSVIHRLHNLRVGLYKCMVLKTIYFALSVHENTRNLNHLIRLSTTQTIDNTKVGCTYPLWSEIGLIIIVFNPKQNPNLNTKPLESIFILGKAHHCRA